MLCAKFGWNWLSGSGEEDFLIWSMYFHYFVIISPRKRAGPIIWTNLYSTCNVIFYYSILSYRALILSYHAYMLFHRACILSYRLWILSCFPFKSLCIVRVSYVSCICNSLGSHETFHCLYGKNQRCSRSGFRFVKKIILRNRSYVNMELNSRGRWMSEKIKIVIVQYLLIHW